MQDKKRVRMFLLLASAAALGAIAAGAAFLLAPVVQPHYHTVDYIPPTYAVAESKKEQEHSASGKMIDLNSATAEELTELKGIGEAKANAIVEYRRQHGGFTTPAEVAQVSGISQSMVDSWAGQICIGTPETAQK